MTKPKGGLSKADQKVWDAVTKTVVPLEQKHAAPALKAMPRIEYRHDATLPDEWFLKDTPAPNTRVDRKTRRKIVTGRQEFDRSVDLHGMTQDQAFSVLKRVVEGCVLRGDKTLLVVTGKGGARFSQSSSTPAAYRTRDQFDQLGGVLRRVVPLWLSGAELGPFVHTYAPAAPEQGGDGALYVLLRRRAPGSRKR
jgi:DNA-nicking Smr family endonuclease